MQATGRGARALVGVISWALATWGCADPEAPAEPVGDSTSGSSGSSGVVGSSDGVVAGPPVSLVRAEAWDLTAPEDDPFADHRPGFVQCEIGWGLETGVFEVDSELCFYGGFSQPSLAPIHAGDELELVVLHDALYAEEAATAHVAVGLGSTVAWEIELPIPSEAGQVRPTWTATEDLEIGSPVHFHVHNHGTNNYRLVALTVAAR